MKAIITMITSLILAFVVAGCSNQAAEPKEPPTQQNQSSNSKPEVQNSSPASTTIDNAEQAKLDEQEFKTNSVQLVYKDIARNPNKFASQKAYFVGKVVQVSERKNDVVLRVEVTRGDYDIWDDVIWVNYTRAEGDDRILEDDIIQIWGVIKGLKTYETVLGSELSVPEVNAAYITIGEPTEEVPSNQTIADSEMVQSEDQDDIFPEGSVKADSFFYEELYRNYENALIDAINSGDFSLVEYMLLPGSSLYDDQKALVKNLSSRGITEEMDDYEILDTQDIEESGIIYITVKEAVKVIKPDSESKVEMTWKYTIKQTEDGDFKFSNIEKV